MTDELGREELLRLLKDSFGNNKLDLQAFQYDFSQEEFNNRMEKLNKAEEQIKALIQKPGVTEAWIEEKAKELLIKASILIQTPEAMQQQLKILKDFIRSLVEEIPAKKATVDEEFVWKMVEESVYILHQDKHIFFQRKLTEAGVEIKK